MMYSIVKNRRQLTVVNCAVTFVFICHAYHPSDYAIKLSSGCICFIGNSRAYFSLVPACATPLHGKVNCIRGFNSRNQLLEQTA